MGILILLILIAFIFGIVCLKAKSRLKKISCKKCGTKFDLDDVSYQEATRYQRETTGAINTFVGIEFEGKCPNCGEEKVFRKAFKSAYYNKRDGNHSTTNVEKSIKDYFKDSKLKFLNKKK